MSQPPASSAPRTRLKSNTTTTRPKTRKELEEAEGMIMLTEVRNKEQALTFVHAKQYLVPSEPINLLNLSYVLLQFAHGAIKLPKHLMDGMRAVAFLMAGTGIQQLAEELSSTVKEQLTKQMEHYNAQVESMRDAVEHVMKAADIITENMGEFKEEFQETMEKLTNAAQELAETRTTTER
ncbi:hypothetical protein L208DRAFT_1396309 [Tricholoma matsutake]|nr:hypothetical protein L208DRAFT_1396309 [Tricholoma matsutake 945]